MNRILREDVVLCDFGVRLFQHCHLRDIVIVHMWCYIRTYVISVFGILIDNWTDINIIIVYNLTLPAAIRVFCLTNRYYSHLISWIITVGGTWAIRVHDVLDSNDYAWEKYWEFPVTRYNFWSTKCLYHCN